MTSNRAARVADLQSRYAMDVETAYLFVRGERLLNKDSPEQAVIYLEEVLARCSFCVEAQNYLEYIRLTLSHRERRDSHQRCHQSSEYGRPGKLYLLEFARHPFSFQAALLDGPELKTCREKMGQAGQSCELPCGAKVFVHAREYALALAMLSSRELRPYHVVVSSDMESLVMEAVGKIPCRSKVKLRSRETVYEPHDVHIRNTFLTGPERVLRNTESVTNSTTEAHRGLNPRRVELNRIQALVSA